MVAPWTASNSASAQVQLLVVRFEQTQANKGVIIEYRSVYSYSCKLSATGPGLCPCGNTLHTVVFVSLAPWPCSCRTLE